MKQIHVRKIVVMLLIFTLFIISVNAASRHNDIWIKGWFNSSNETFRLVGIAPDVTMPLQINSTGYLSPSNNLTLDNITISDLAATNITTDNLLVVNAPAECPIGTGMIYTNMTTSVCSQDVGWWLSNGNDIYNNNTGNIGIGTTSPADDLNIRKTSTGTVGVLVENRDTTNQGNARYWIKTLSNGGDPIILFDIDSTKLWSMGIDNSDSDSFKISESSGVGTDNRLTILSGGDVGIGTTSPDYRLTVESAGGDLFKINNTITTGGTNFDMVAGTNHFRFKTTAPGGWKIRDVENSMDVFYIQNNTGYVGIGTIVPNATLDLHSGSNTQSLKIRGAAILAEVADLYVQSSGNFNIDLTAGNDNAQFLDIKTEDDEFGVIIRESDGTGTAAYGNIYVTDAATDYMSLVTTSATDCDGLNIDQNNRVGIGICNPSVLFEIKSNDAGVNPFMANTNDEGISTWLYTGRSGAAGFENKSIFQNEINEDILFFTTGSVGIGNVADPVNTLDVEGAVVIGSAYSGSNTAPTNGLAVEGKVGIGTANPDDFLEIQGTLGGGGIHVDSNTGAAIKIDRGGTSNTGVLSLQTGGATRWSLGNFFETNNNFHIYEDSASEIRFTIEDETGFVGIGTEDPAGIFSFGTQLFTDSSYLALYEEANGANLYGFNISAGSLEMTVAGQQIGSLQYISGDARFVSETTDTTAGKFTGFELANGSGDFKGGFFLPNEAKDMVNFWTGDGLAVVLQGTDTNVTGNFFGNQIYGEMWNRSSSASPWTFPIAADGIYYNLTGLVAGMNNGFTFTDETQLNGGSYLTVQHDGRYKVDATISWITSTAGGTYGFAIVHDFDVETHRNCYARRQATNSVGNVGITCIMDLQGGDQVNMQVEDEAAPARDIEIHNVNINLVRIGDFE